MPFWKTACPMPVAPLSEQTSQAIDEEVKALVDAGHQKALAVLTENRDLLETLAGQLLEEEVVEGPRLREVLCRVKEVSQGTYSPELTPV